MTVIIQASADLVSSSLLFLPSDPAMPTVSWCPSCPRQLSDGLCFSDSLTTSNSVAVCAAGSLFALPHAASSQFQT